MFIEIAKITKKERKVSDGTIVKNPHSSSPVKVEYSVNKESIRVDEIQSYRAWHKNIDQECSIEGEMSIVYLYGNKSKDNRVEVLMNESYDSFVQRLNTVRLNNE